MNEKILAQFCINEHEYVETKSILENEYGFEQANVAEEYRVNKGEWEIIFSGRMDSTAATFIKLRHRYIADRMCVSYISDDLKNKYRS